MPLLFLNSSPRAAGAQVSTCKGALPSIAAEVSRCIASWRCMSLTALCALSQ
eukprot:CAMPEP_0175751618 /NCGR_PEP_ID=MMETSP0097-20121207/61318_1 /TAXON_ID=311494 /ORGANISM="Alexandrium monilatum, Strain CCMP3105" /LENGTH=51 /DNA_ID=CAMNT_0017060329 /DNA_START=63 /DNA_END=215 /DNA_ORIENTATION=+